MPGPYGESEGFSPYEPGSDPRADEPPAAAAPPPQPPLAQPKPGRGRWIALIAAVVVVGMLAAAGLGVAALVSAVKDTATSGDDPLSTDDLVVGECLIGAGFDPRSDESVSDMQDVDCATAHDAEVLQINVLDDAEAGAYDIDDDSQIDQHCRQLLDPDQKQLMRDDQYFLLGLTESQHPSTGDHVACLLVRGDGGPLHGRLG